MPLPVKADQRRKLSLKGHLRLSFLMILMTMVVVGLFVDQRMRVVNDKSTEMAENWVPSIIAVSAINTGTSDYRAAEGLHILSTDRESMDRYEKEMSRLEKEISEWRAKYKPLISSDEERALYQSFSRKYDEYLTASKKTVGLSRKNDNDAASNQLKASGRLFDDMSDELNKLVALNRKGGEAASSEGDVIYDATRRRLKWIGLASFVFVVVLVLLVERRLSSREIADGRPVAQRILSLHYRAPSAILIIAVTGATVITSVLSNRLFNGMTVSVENGELSLVKAAVDSALKSAELKALSRAESVADLPRVQVLMAARDRQKLLEELRPMIDNQVNKYGVSLAQFHLPPAHAFLNLTAPEEGAEDMSKHRPIVVAVNREHVAQSGFAVTNSGPGIFGVAPVFDGEHNPVGSFELGLGVDGMCDELRSSLNLETALLVDEDMLWTNAKSLPKATFSAENRAGQYIRYYATNSTLMRRLVAPIDLVDPQAQYDREVDGVHYGVVLTPIRDGSGEVRGVLVAAKDLSSLRSGEGRSVVWQVLMAFIAIVLLTGVIMVVVRGVLANAIQVIRVELQPSTHEVAE